MVVSIYKIESKSVSVDLDEGFKLHVADGQRKGGGLGDGYRWPEDGGFHRLGAEEDGRSGDDQEGRRGKGQPELVRFSFF